MGSPECLRQSAGNARIHRVTGKFRNDLIRTTFPVNSGGKIAGDVEKCLLLMAIGADE